MGVHAVKENPPNERSTNVASRAPYEDVGDVADVLLHIQSQILKGGAENRDAHALQRGGGQVKGGGSSP